MFPEAFAVKHLNSKVRMDSRSGGIFSAVSDAVLKRNGVIYGCILDENFIVRHVRTQDSQGRNKMRKSKYVQSDLGNSFSSVKRDLEQNRTVLFSGTPCQIDGLNSYLGDVYYDNLITIDIVCHGVPSPLVWKDYLKWIEQTKNAKITEVEFRNKKKFGWKAHVETIKLNNGRIIDSEVYKKLFYSHLTLRPSCYNCPYKNLSRVSDISIADFWGIDSAIPGFNDDKGVSLVLINTNKGQEWLDNCCTSILLEKVNIEKCLQAPLVCGFDAPKNRSSFWSDYSTMTFSSILKKYENYGISYNLRSYLYRTLKFVMMAIASVSRTSHCFTKSK